MSEPLLAHSLAEAYLYLMATPCPSCGKGPLKGLGGHPVGEKTDLHLEMVCVCGDCRHKEKLLFHLPYGTGPRSEDELPIYNPTDKPSVIVDVVQWLTLFQAITEAAGKERDKQHARRLGIESALCIEEALKFYDEDNDLPPPEAFFHEATRRQLRENPERLSRRRLISLRQKLPSISYMKRRTAEGAEKAKKKRWWRFGR